MSGYETGNGELFYHEHDPYERIVCFIDVVFGFVWYHFAKKANFDCNDDFL